MHAIYDELILGDLQTFLTESGRNYNLILAADTRANYLRAASAGAGSNSSPMIDCIIHREKNDPVAGFAVALQKMLHSHADQLYPGQDFSPQAAQSRLFASD